MATIKGENLRIFLRPKGAPTGYRAVAAATNCTLHCALQVQEDTTKDTVDDWIEQEPVGLNWDVQVEALVLSGDDEEYRPGAINADQLQVGRVYLLRFTRTAGASGEQNRDAVADAMQLTGSAILNDLQINSQNGELSTYTAQFTGHGELAISNPSDDQGEHGSESPEQPV